MKPLRIVFCAVLTLAAASACNAILGIEDLKDPGSSDGGGTDAPRGDAPVPTDGGSDATSDAMPMCSATGDPDPCMYIEPQEAGAIFPTWHITSDLNISDGQGFSGPLAAEYTDDDAGAVTEKYSQLTWQKAQLNGGATYTFAEATAACSALAGKGWRVPTRIEAATIQYRDAVLTTSKPGYVRCVPPAFDATYPYTWTTATLPGQSDQAYVPVESNGATACGFIVESKTANKYGARCVRGDTKPATFIVMKAKARVVAVDTGLVWERQGTVVAGYAEAKAHCDVVGLRIPIIQELYGILDTRSGDLFHPTLFVAPVVEAGAVQSILSQTVYGVDPDGGLSYEVVDTHSLQIGQENATGEVWPGVNILVRCVGRAQ